MRDGELEGYRGTQFARERPTARCGAASAGRAALAALRKTWEPQNHRDFDVLWDRVGSYRKDLLGSEQEEWEMLSQRSTHYWLWFLLFGVVSSIVAVTRQHSLDSESVWLLVTGMLGFSWEA